MSRLEGLLAPWGLHGALLPWYRVQAGSVTVACNMSHSCLTVFPPCLQLKSFHNELLTQLEQKVELDSRYLSVSTACPCLCLEICLLDGLPP